MISSKCGTALPNNSRSPVTLMAVKLELEIKTTQVLIVVFAVVLVRYDWRTHGEQDEDNGANCQYRSSDNNTRFDRIVNSIPVLRTGRQSAERSFCVAVYDATMTWRHVSRSGKFTLWERKR